MARLHQKLQKVVVQQIGFNFPEPRGVNSIIQSFLREDCPIKLIHLAPAPVFEQHISVQYAYRRHTIVFNTFAYRARDRFATGLLRE